MSSQFVGPPMDEETELQRALKKASAEGRFISITDEKDESEKKFTVNIALVPSHWEPGITCGLNGELFVLFSRITADIETTLGVSPGVAERTLRELCAKGDIRSVRFQLGVDYEDEDQEPERIKPSEWLKTEVDMDGSEFEGVAVSYGDFLYWLRQQKQPEELSKRDTAIANLLQSGKIPPDKLP